MVITAATADTTEAMELIAVQMLSIGFLLSVDNYYTNKPIKVIKSDTPRSTPKTGHAAGPARAEHRRNADATRDAGMTTAAFAAGGPNQEETGK